MKGESEKEECLVEFMDSLDNYLTLLHSLSSTLRQGWLELASARHSMGCSRMSSALLDLSEHSAQTTCSLSHHPDTHPHFILNKWGSSTEDINFHAHHCHTNSRNRNSLLRLRHPSNQQNHEFPDKEASTNVLHPADNDQVQRQKRSKSLSVFGGLVPPKLRAGQISFEKGFPIKKKPLDGRFGIARTANLSFTAKPRPLAVQASYGDGGRPSSASFFVGGFVLGGLVAGALGCAFAPQISNALAGADKKDLMKKLPKFIYDEEKALEKTRKTLAKKIEQLNSAIDDVSARLHSEDDPRDAVKNSDEVPVAI